MTLKLEVYGVSDRGLVREDNQDSLCMGKLKDNAVWAVVCDGMGGAKAGNVASEEAAKLIEQRVKDIKDSKLNGDEIKSLMITFLQEANNHIYQMSISNEEMKGMGTTAVFAIVIENKAYLANAGDSRAYLIDADNIRQITKDHSMVQEMLDDGQITRSQAEVHPRKNIITRALGILPEIDIDYFEIDFNDEDIIFLCTDGLTNHVNDEEILKLIKNTNVDKIANKAINLANKAGGNDNITVAILKK